MTSTHSAARWPALGLAWLIWGLVMILVALSFVIRMWGGADYVREAGLTGADLFFEVLYWIILIPTAAPAYATVGALVLARQPRSPVAWLCLILGVLIALQDTVWQYSLRADLAPDGLPGGMLAAWLTNLLGALMFPPMAFILIVFLFPDGRLVSPRWRWIMWLGLVGMLLAVFGAISAPDFFTGPVSAPSNPTGIEALAGAANLALTLGALLQVVAFFGAIVSLIVRWRRATGDQRMQLKWLAYASVVVALGFGSGILAETLGANAWISGLLFGVSIAGMALGIPIAIAFAMRRYRLYDIDLIINRTLVYGALTILLALTYLGSVVALQAVFRAVTGHSSSVTIVISTLATAALFNPLRARLQRAIDRRFYRSRYNAEQTLLALSDRLRNEVDLDRLTADLLMIVSETMQPAHISLWLRKPEQESR